MPTRAPLRALLLAAALLPASADAQSPTRLSLDLSYGLFDGVAIGLAHVGPARAQGVAVATGMAHAPAYGIYSRDRTGYRGDPARGGWARTYDACWEASWELGWNRGWHGDPWFDRYDHLDFYHDCLSGGLGYAWGRYRGHARRSHDLSIWRGRHGAYGPVRGVVVSVYVRDPFWRPWGPYWSYDPWGWYWDGYRDGWHAARWGRPARVVHVDRFGGRRARPSPLAEPRFKEDPRVRAPEWAGAERDGRRAVPRAGLAPVGRATAGAGRPTARDGGVRRAPAPVEREGRPSAAARPSDAVRGGAPARREPEARRTGEARPARPPAPAVGTGGRVPPAAGERGQEPAPRRGDERPSAGRGGGSARPAPTPRPSTRSGAAPSPAVDRARPATRAPRDSNAPRPAAPTARSSGGDSRSGPTERRPATR